MLNDDPVTSTIYSDIENMMTYVSDNPVEFGPILAHHPFDKTYCHDATGLLASTLFEPTVLAAGVVSTTRVSTVASEAFVCNVNSVRESEKIAETYFFELAETHNEFNDSNNSQAQISQILEATSETLAK